MVPITTEYPDFIPFLTYATDAAAREELWRLFRQRGHPANVDVLRRMLERRHELATLLGYPSWAEYAAEDKMIGSAAEHRRLHRAHRRRRPRTGPGATTTGCWPASGSTTPTRRPCCRGTRPIWTIGSRPSSSPSTPRPCAPTSSTAGSRPG